MVKVYGYPPHAREAASAQSRAVSRAARAYRIRREGIRDKPQAAREMKGNARPHSVSHRTASGAATTATADQLADGAAAGRGRQLRETVPQTAPSTPADAKRAASPRRIPPGSNQDREVRPYRENARRT